jgi:rhodanese-related sulfurtransferase
VEPEPEPEPEPDLELSAEAVLRRMNGGEAVVLVDVRESNELWSGHARDAILAPMSQFQDLAASLPDGPLLAIYCAAGARSYGIADFLRQNGRANAWSIPEGFGGWIDVGGPWLQPVTDTDWKLLQPVRLTADAASGRGMEGTPAGQIQSVERVAGEVRLAIRTRDGQWIANLEAHEVASIGRR